MTLRGAGLRLAAAVIAADLATKLVAYDMLFSPPRQIVVTGFLNLTPVWNRGVSFGLLANDSPYGPYLLSGFALAVCAVIWWWLGRAENRVVALGLGAVLGGAAGNVIDRLRFGAVVDFIDVHVAGWHWPAFNLADAAISLGVAALLADGLFARRDGGNKGRSGKEAP
ncbi:MAG: signal peptidase II [Thalassobaculales bacterium]